MSTENSLSGFELKKYKKDEIIFVQSDAAGELFIIKSGQVRVFKTEGDQDVELDIIGPGGIIGEVAAIDGGTRSAGVVAIIDTEVFVVSGDQFRTLIQKMPDWFYKIVSILAKRLRDIDGKIEQNYSSDKSANVAALLLLMVDSGRGDVTPEGISFNYKMVENEVADILNLQVADCATLLEGLVKKKICIIDKGKLVIIFKTALEALAKPIFAEVEEIPVET